MSQAFLNIAIGLVTSFLSGGSVWIWQRGKNARILRRKAALFGLTPGEPCLIVMTSRYDKPGTSSNHDVQAFIEIATLATQIGCPVSVGSSDDVSAMSPHGTEFCVGGPDSNARTGAHLATYLPAVSVLPFAPDNRDSLAIVVGDHQFRWERGVREYVLVAKFRPPGSSRPVTVVCGQTAICNRAAMHVLNRDFRQLRTTLASIDRFCIVIRVESSNTYGHQAASLDRDVTDLAFAAH